MGEIAVDFRALEQGEAFAVAGMRQNLAELHGLIVTAHGNHASAVRSNSAIWAV